VTAAKTRSQLGAMSRNKGAKAERDLVAYLRMVGFGGAERAVRTGYRTKDRTSADPGDITGTPGIVWSVKDCAVDEHPKWLAELDAMHGQATDVRLLVHKRRGHAIPDKWWCWMRQGTYGQLYLDWIEGIDAVRQMDPLPVWPAVFPIRMELGHVIDLLRLVGYGDSTEVTA
jgi:hypothetical protein